MQQWLQIDSVSCITLMKSLKGTCSPDVPWPCTEIEQLQSHHLSFYRKCTILLHQCYICNVAWMQLVSGASTLQSLQALLALHSIYRVFLAIYSFHLSTCNVLFSSLSVLCFNWRTRSLSHSVKVVFQEMDPFPYIHDTQGNMTTHTQTCSLPILSA